MKYRVKQIGDKFYPQFKRKFGLFWFSIVWKKNWCFVTPCNSLDKALKIIDQHKKKINVVVDVFNVPT